MQINKYLSHNTKLSRRKADLAIKDGRVTINGVVAKNSDRVTVDKDIISLDKENVYAHHEKFIYILLNKPKEVLSTTHDDRGRKTILDIVKTEHKVYPVGRLDYDSTGIILLTNDGDLALKMTHPKYHVPKSYIVKVREKIEYGQLDIIRNGGVPIEDKMTSKTDITLIDDHNFEITLYEGIKRQIKMSCRHVGLHVIELKRISIGKLKLGDLKEGEYRFLEGKELDYINELKKDPEFI